MINCNRNCFKTGVISQKSCADCPVFKAQKIEQNRIDRRFLSLKIQCEPVPMKLVENVMRVI